MSLKSNNQDLIDENKRIFNNLKENYLKLRKEHWELKDKYEEIEELVKKLIKEIRYKTELINEYHLEFGEEILVLFEKKRAKVNNDSDTMDVEELLK